MSIYVLQGQYFFYLSIWMGVVTEQTFPNWPNINVTVGVGVSYCHTNSDLSIFNRLNLHSELQTVGKNILSNNIRIPLIYNSIPLRVHFLLLYIYIMYRTARREKQNRSSGWIRDQLLILLTLIYAHSPPDEGSMKTRPFLSFILFLEKEKSDENVLKKKRSLYFC